MTAVLFVATGAIALADWLAVWKRYFRVEYLLKPLVLVLLIGAVLAADLPVVKAWVLAALVFGLVGDVVLMFARAESREVDAAFLLGLASFLAGHVCYLAAFARHGVHTWQMVAGALVVIGSASLTLPRVLGQVRRVGGPELMVIVAAYAALLGAMAVLAVGTAVILTAIGGLLFLASDTALAWERFVAYLPHGPVLVAVTYHLAQLLIVLGLIHR